ncbi:hypothetical protein ABW20_dc0101164 [Dactylellina cionopaga]|nr:hypothetical protein ABW20_dc0101164 [Dactylellina cionopaga]
MLNSSRLERQESHNISPGSAYPPESSQGQQQQQQQQHPNNNPNTASTTTISQDRPTSLTSKPGSSHSSSNASNYFPYQPLFHSRDDSQGSFSYGMNMGPLGDHRRDLKVLQGPGGSANGYSSSNPTLTQTPPSASPTGQTWKGLHHSSSFGSNPHDSTFGVASVLDDMAKLSSSPDFKHTDIFSPLNMEESPQASRNPGSMDFSYSGNSIDGYFTSGDDRRPSVASVNTTASSTTSKTSLGKRLNGKLHGIFGDAEGGHHHHHHHHPHHTNTIPITPPPVSQSDTNLPGQKLFHATTAPVGNSSRPRTPQPPSSDVVPYLFQNAADIQQYGEAPVQNQLVNDRHRYRDEQSIDPKSSAHNFFHWKGDKTKTPAKPSSRDYDGGASDKELPQYRREMYGGSTTNLPRASSPSPSVRSMNSGIGSFSNAAGQSASAAPGGEKATKRSFLKGMLKGRDKRPKDEELEASALAPAVPRKDRHPSIKAGEQAPGPAGRMRPDVPKRGTTAPLTSEFNINPALFALPDYYHSHGNGNSKKALGSTTPSGSKTKKRGDSFERPLGKEAGKYNNVVAPDTTGMSLDIFDLTNMEGIVAQSPPPTHTSHEPRSKQKQESHGSWNAPDSWAVGGRASKLPETHTQEETEGVPEEMLRKQSLSQVWRVSVPYNYFDINNFGAIVLHSSLPCRWVFHYSLI